MQTLEAKHTVSQYDPLEKVLSQLHTVQFVNGRYRAACPAHDDQTPSLSITEGRSGLLLKCWAGCTFDEILAALDVEACELFYDYREKRDAGAAGRRYEPPLNTYWNWREQINELMAITETRAVLAEDFIERAKGVDLSRMNAENLESFQYQKELAEKWIATGLNMAGLCYDLTQRLRAQEVTR